ncbi:hypothetical protein FO519_006046 [Halicephalobus sp. NKZ332]|nr:hypothetical protein FO519_006046 [Halicephalobus sp. NKZ332]
MSSMNYSRYDEPPVDYDNPAHYDDSVNRYPDPSDPVVRPHSLSVLTVQTDTAPQITVFSPTSSSIQSPTQKVKLYNAKKKYSVGDDSLRFDEMPVFDKRDIKQKKKGPSSPTTVLTMAGLFVCGVTLMLSGTIVLLQEEKRPFMITGGIFLGLGLLMMIICIFLQWKNVVKYVLDLNRDLYFLKMSDSYMWKLMFKDEDSNLPVPHDH